MPEEMRAIGYICPECGKAVYGERTIFALSAAAVGLVCECGRSELTAVNSKVLVWWKNLVY